MSIKLRFALFFTLFVAIILLVSSFTVFFLYKNNREEDYYARLKTHCLGLLTDYRNLHSDSNALVGSRLQRRSLFSQQIILIKRPATILYKETDSIKVTVTNTLFDKIKTKKELRFKDGENECLGMYVDDLDLYVIGQAVDRTGLRKLTNLSYILIGVFGGGLLITAFMSFFIVQQAFKPLTILNTQIQETTSTNLNFKIDEGNGKDEIQQIAKNFNAMLERLKQGFDRQRSFVQHASHELRTPLTTMLSQTEAALNRNLTKEEYKKLLISLQEEQTELIELTNSLLILSQFERINTPTNRPLVRIDELLYESISASKRSFSDIDIDLSFVNIPDSEEELMIKGNDALLKSAFRNLIKNAYLYSNNKKVNISINSTSNQLDIFFINDGEVIPQNEIDKILIPFFRGENAARIKGFGLGLSIISKICEMHNANISYTVPEPHKNKFAISFFTKPMANRSITYINMENLYN